MPGTAPARAQWLFERMPAKSMSRPKDGRSEPMRASQSSAAGHRELDWARNIAGVERWGSLAAGGLAIVYGSAGGLAAGRGSLPRERRSGPGRDRPLPGLLAARRHDVQQQSTRARHSAAARHPRARGHQAREAAGRGLRILAPARKPAAVHDPSRARHRPGRRTFDWVAKGPAGNAVEWDAEIINEVENKVIGWRSLPGAES